MKMNVYSNNEKEVRSTLESFFPVFAGNGLQGFLLILNRISILPTN
ncbi:hypothetical protein Q9R46_17470 [Paenibacillus sp. RRE4]|nr:hypothetical protein [Paenibacillus sp. RRE4]MDT0124454.1 hypothetical protein [Paenibacillus sp. RRE4]